MNIGVALPNETPEQPYSVPARIAHQHEDLT
jgi:hypothetical protein